MKERKEYIDLLERLEETKQSVAKMVVKRDYQAFHDSAILEIDYRNKIGKLEDEIIQKEYELRRIKRKIDILRAYPSLIDNIQVVENQLDMEYETEIKKLKDQKRRNDFLLVTEKFRYPDLDCPEELNQLYESLVRKMHIIFNPEATDEEMQIWERVQSAYIKKDLEALRQLDMITVKLFEFVPNPDDIWDVVDEIEEYETILLDVSDEYEIRKNDFPFTYEETLKNNALLKGRTLNDQQVLQHIREEYAGQQRILEALIQQKEG